MRRSHVLTTILLILISVTAAACDMLPAVATAPPEPTADAALPTEQVPPPVENTPEAATEEAAPTPTLPPSVQPTTISAWPLAADLFVLNGAGQVWRQPRSGDESAASAVTPLEATAQDFAIAPGGSWLAYRTADNIVVSGITGQDAQIVAQAAGLPEGWNGAGHIGTHSIAWSADGEKLAYVTGAGFTLAVPGTGSGFEGVLYPVSEAPLASLSFSADGGWLLAERADGTAVLYQVDPLQEWVDLGPINGAAWLSDGRLTFAPGAGGLVLLTPGDAASRQFVVPQDRQVSLPTERADGLIAFFSHTGSLDQPGFLHAADPAATSFRVESSVGVDTSLAVWEPGGARLLAEGPSPDVLTVLDPLTGASGSITPPGEAARVDWGAEPSRSVTGLTLPADLYYLAPQNDVIQVWRLPASGDGPQVVTFAGADVLSFDISPDGERIVYDSDGAIWQASLTEGSEPERVLQLVAAAAAPAATPEYSPDGVWIAYANNGIWINNLETGLVRQTTVDRNTNRDDHPLYELYDMPRWSPDGNWLLGRATFHEGSDTVLIPLEGDPSTRGDPVLLGIYGAHAKWMDSGQIVAMYEGGVYGQPYVSVFAPGGSPAANRILNISARDAQLRPDDGRLALLRVPMPGVGLPPVVRAASAELDGSDLREETGPLAVEEAIFSPDTSMIAGLRDGQASATGAAQGQLVLADALTGQVFVIDGVSAASRLKWGQ